MTRGADQLLAAVAEMQAAVGGEEIARALLRWSVQVSESAGGSVVLEGLAAPLQMGTRAEGGTALGVPLQRRGQCLGSLELYEPRRQARALVEMLAVCAAAALQHEQRFRELEERSLIDPATGLHSRRYLDRRLREEIERSAPSGGAIGVIETDIDHMGAIKAAHGQDVADRTVEAFASQLEAWVGEDGVCGRHGGDEFLVILHDPTPESAREVGEHIRAGAESAAINGVRLTASVGVAVTDDPAQMPQAVELADRALYEAKESGRNQVRVVLA
jgi:two-component system, cell cycle response regulator